jgi:lysophospholipase L1-like esterase
MGGSAAYGISSAPPFPSVVITNTQTIDYKLERLLHELFPEIQIEVINAGVTAYWTHHNLIYLHETILDYNPDLVIFLDGINDYYHTRPDHRQFSSYKFSLTLKTNDLNHPTPMAALQSFLGWGKEYSHALFIANDAADRLFGWSRAPDDPCNLESIRPEQLTKQFREQYEAISRRTWVRTLRTILMSLKDQRIAAITTLQPELIFTQTKGMSEADLRLHAMELAIRPPYYKEKKEFLKPVTVRLAQESASQFGATLVDLTDLFDSHEQYFIDYCHLTEAGAQRIAETLLPHVTAQIAAQHKSQLQSSLYYSAPRLPQ